MWRTTMQARVCDTTSTKGSNLNWGMYLGPKIGEAGEYYQAKGAGLSLMTLYLPGSIK